MAYQSKYGGDEIERKLDLVDINKPLSEINEEVVKLKILVESGAGGGEGGSGLIIVDKLEYLDLLDVPQGTIASVVTETENETEKPLAELYDFIAEGGNPQGEVDYDILPKLVDVALTLPNLPTWPDGRILIGREGGVASSRYHLVVDSTRVRFAYGQGEILLLAENNGETILRYDDAVAQMHEILRGVDGLRYMGISAGSIEDLSQFFAIIQREVLADAYILGETWKRLMKDGEMPEIDLSALAQKTDLDALTEAVVENEEVTAAALNDLNDRVKAIPTAIDAELSETSANPVQNKAITTKLNEKQDALVSGTSIKTINGQSLLGEGNLEVVTDLSAMATKAELQDLSDVVANAKAELQGGLESLTTEIVTNEEVTAAALNDLNNRVTEISASITEIIARLDAMSV